MNALEALHTRVSISQLQEPAPTPDQLENIIQAGLHANDRLHLRPWKFLTIEGKARQKFADLWLKVTLEHTPELSKEKQDKISKKPFNAPLIIVVVAKIDEHHFKVPAIEQHLSAAGSAQMMMLAAHAQGIGAIWRTGTIAYNQKLHDGLGLEKGDKIVGFLYMGTAKQTKLLTEIKSSDFSRVWKG